MKETVIDTITNPLKKEILKINENTYLLPLESNSDDERVDCNYWSFEEPNKFIFSENIVVLYATYLKNGGAVIVQKKDDSILEHISIYDGKKNVNLSF